MKHSIIYMLFMLVCILACNKMGSETDDHKHDHEDIKLQLTKYTDDFELFAETDPFVKDHTIKVLAHITKLSDFKPLTEGNVTLSLIVGNNGIRQTTKNPIRPGIYEFALLPGVEGTGTLIFEIRNNDKSHKLVVNNVKVYGDEHAAIHETEKSLVDNVNAIQFTKEQSWKIDFETVLPGQESFGTVIKTSAQIQNNPKDEILVTARTNGIVNINKNMMEGIAVDKGEVFVTISGDGLANNNASVRFQEAKNNYDLVSSDYERKLTLSKNQIISGKEVEEAKANYENAKAVFENLKKNFNVNGQLVISPNKGFVKHVYVSNGEYVEPGRELYSLINNNSLLVKVELQQKYYSSLGSINGANLKSTIDHKMYQLNDLNGKLLSFGKILDQDEGFLIPVIFQIDNNGKFLPGSLTEVYIKTTSGSKALLVPNNSLIEEQGNFFVLVQITPELFEKREVKTGASDGMFTEIISGLSVDERIVSKGAIIVKLAAVSNSLDPHAGHVH